MNKIAILYQAKRAPKKGGIQKPLKLGGYSDSGADIANALVKHDVLLVTPVAHPKAENDLDWVFPDTTLGIQSALEKGARIFWLNTVLYRNHPITGFFSQNIEIIGQTPDIVDVYDDKWVTNQLLKKNGIPIPNGLILNKNSFDQNLKKLRFPLIIKPIRGRGSQGVSLIKDLAGLKEKLDVFFSIGKYGNRVYIEEYLDGEELTITVMPPGKYNIQHKEKVFNTPWCLPAIKRFNHKDGIAPYSGIVAIIENSKLLDSDRQHTPEIQELYHYCATSATLLNIKAPIRIDCRAHKNGGFYLFDLNLKPNMTGPSRSHRLNQDSLSSLAARGLGWNYFDFLKNIINQRWAPDF
ncbi:ATP-grasp domain-containing protein [Tamlana sp. 2201CG12-4]|uniref:ATP-grasp domain-containing protein n=1 Tax=Tamlana sp. 2201CG12-4 TaxID=3112582 RepID=UPI002DBA9A3D|nr:ATP-grasp domain-containing protein [Tamlana sp. 2201CG12-4]MEC3907771.1 ATP-grasp domain-containing protein [Tamlana sp. 2201CG12-4]